MNIKLINREFGNADLFLIDKILKGFFIEDSVVLDAGCGEGRNLSYFLRNNFRVYGIDRNESALTMLRIAGRMIKNGFNPDCFVQGDILDLPFADDFFDYVLCFSVLHHAGNESDFHRMITNLAVSLKTGGYLMIGMNSVFGRTADGGTLGRSDSLPDDDGRVFMLDDAILHSISDHSGLNLAEPVKTWIIHGRETTSYMIFRKEYKPVNYLKRPLSGIHDPVI